MFDPHATATAAVPAVVVLCLRRYSTEYHSRHPVCVTTGLKLASCNHNISAVIALFYRLQITDRLFLAFSVLPDAVSLSECCCDFDFWVVNDRLTPVVLVTGCGGHCRSPSGLYTPDSAVFVAPQGFQTAVTALLRLPCTGNRIIDGTAHRAGKGNRQPAFLLLKFFVHSTTVMPRVNHHTVTGNADIPVRNHIRTADMSLFARGNAPTLPAVE